MFQLKPISKAGIPEALEKAERYRLLNEPRLAESICLDILEVDKDNHDAIVTLLLAITDSFGRSNNQSINEARELLPRLRDDYERSYYGGIICERQGRAALTQAIPGAHFTAYEWLHEAMIHYEQAERLRPQGNDDSILRWNTCARMIMRNHLRPRDEDNTELSLE